MAFCECTDSTKFKSKELVNKFKNIYKSEKTEEKMEQKLEEKSKCRYLFHMNHIFITIIILKLKRKSLRSNRSPKT